MKKVILTETELVKLISRIVSESAGLTLNGRALQIPGDGTIILQDAKNKMVKIKMSSSLGDINVAKIEPSSDGYNVTGRSGMTKNIDKDTVNQIISFVDKPDTATSIRKGLITLKLNKV